MVSLSSLRSSAPYYPPSWVQAFARIHTLSVEELINEYKNNPKVAEDYASKLTKSGQYKDWALLKNKTFSVGGLTDSLARLCSHKKGVESALKCEVQLNFANLFIDFYKNKNINTSEIDETARSNQNKNIYKEEWLISDKGFCVKALLDALLSHYDDLYTAYVTKLIELCFNLEVNAPVANSCIEEYKKKRKDIDAKAEELQNSNDGYKGDYIIPGKIFSQQAFIDALMLVSPESNRLLSIEIIRKAFEENKRAPKLSNKYKFENISEEIINLLIDEYSKNYDVFEKRAKELSKEYKFSSNIERKEYSLDALVDAIVNNSPGLSQKIVKDTIEDCSKYCDSIGIKTETLFNNYLAKNNYFEVEAEKNSKLTNDPMIIGKNYSLNSLMTLLVEDIASKNIELGVRHTIDSNSKLKYIKSEDIINKYNSNSKDFETKAIEIEKENPDRYKNYFRMEGKNFSMVALLEAILRSSPGLSQKIVKAEIEDFSFDSIGIKTEILFNNYLASSGDFENKARTIRNFSENQREVIMTKDFDCWSLVRVLIEDIASKDIKLAIKYALAIYKKFKGLNPEDIINKYNSNSKIFEDRAIEIEEKEEDPDLYKNCFRMEGKKFSIYALIEAIIQEQ